MSIYVFVHLALLVLCRYHCDASSDDAIARIVGGEEVVPGRYPFMVTLFDYSDKYKCGGSLIAPGWVLTAGHCGGVKTVQIGNHDLSNVPDAVETIEVLKEYVHPYFRDISPPQNDLLMLRLKFNSNYSPTVSIYSDIPPNGVDVTVIGWGSTTEGGSVSTVLREVEVDVVSNDVCNVNYGGAVTSDMMCAARLGKDACGYDSGGPLIFKNPDGDASQDVQVGVVSWGSGCADPNYPGVYARVDIEFILNTEQGFWWYFMNDGFDYSYCEIPNTSWLGDGVCDVSNPTYNTAACNYDGGDCAVPTTIETFPTSFADSLLSTILSICGFL